MKKLIMILSRYSFYSVAILTSVYAIIFLKVGVNAPAAPTADWWSALSIMSALFITVLVFSFIKAKEVEDIKKIVEGLKKDVEEIEPLSRIPSMLIDVYDENYFSNDKLWANNYKEIEKLFELGYYDSRAIRRFSNIAWKEGKQEICFKLRQLAYEKEKNNSFNKTYLLSVFPFAEDKIEVPFYFKTKKRIENFIELNEHDRAFAMGKAAYGRYLLKHEFFDEAIANLTQAVVKNETMWHFRSLVIAYIMTNRMNDLKSKLSEWESNDTIWNYNKYEKNKVFKMFINAFIEEYDKSEKTEARESFYKLFNPVFISKYSDIRSFNRFSAFGVIKSLSNISIYPTEKHDNIESLKQIYLTYYYLFGDQDFEADELLNDEKVNEILKKIMSHWQQTI